MCHINYEDVYEKLYQVGYRPTDKNCGALFLVRICEQFEFTSILDVGCGSGSSISYLLGQGKKAQGIDVAKTVVEKALSKNRVCQMGSILNIPFSDNSFDVTFSSDCIEHLMPCDIDQALNEMLRVCKQYVMLQIAIKQSKERDKRNNITWMEKAGVDISHLHLTVWSAEQWKLKLEEMQVSICLFESTEKYVYAIMRKV